MNKHASIVLQFTLNHLLVVEPFDWLPTTVEIMGGSSHEEKKTVLGRNYMLATTAASPITFLKNSSSAFLLEAALFFPSSQRRHNHAMISGFLPSFPSGFYYFAFLWSAPFWSGFDDDLVQIIRGTAAAVRPYTPAL